MRQIYLGLSKNYKPTSLLSAIYKVFIELVDKIEKKYWKTPRKLVWSRTENNTVDPDAMNKYLVLEDFEKTFDTVYEEAGIRAVQFFNYKE